MLRDEGVAIESMWTGTGASMRHGAGVHAGACVRGGADESCREIDRQLRRIAKRKAGLEIEEARWLREAEQQRIWRKLGFSTALEYLEDVFGYAPRTGMERLRVAKELAELPALEAAVRAGELPYSAARELTRVMTSETEDAWLARARGRNLRDIEELVAGRKKGDTPEAAKNPELNKRKRVLELSPRVDALFEQSRGVLADELGSHVDDELLIESLCRGLLAGRGNQSIGESFEGGTAGGGTVGGGTAGRGTAGGGTAAEDEARTTRRRAKAPRPAHRIVIVKCDNCSAAFQQGRGRKVQLTANELALVECDAEVVHMDRASTMSNDRNECEANGWRGAENAAQRATPTIPQRIRNLVWTRDQGRCRVPGCGATRNLDIHHIVHREDGGDHDPGNLTVMCSGHHKLHHSGLLEITGRAPDHLRFVRDGKCLVDARSGSESIAGETLRASTASNKLATVIKLEEAKQALVKLGFKRRDAKTALEQVSAHVARGADVPALVRAVLAQHESAAVSEGDDLIKLAHQALVQLGFSAAVATRAVEQASAHVGSVELTILIKEALRQCR